MTFISSCDIITVSQKTVDRQIYILLEDFFIMKIKKVISAAAAAAICCTMVSGFAVSAEEAAVSGSTSVIADMYAADPLWTECKKLAGAKYSSKYVKMAESYSKKKAKNSITFGKSRSKSFFTKFYKAASSEKPSLSFSMVSKDLIVSVDAKDDKSRTVMYVASDEMTIAMAMYADSKGMTMLDISSKTKIVQEMDGAASAANTESVLPQMAFDDSAKGKVFKFTSDGKKYVYEEFEDDTVGKMGILFNSSNVPVAMLDNSGTYCFSYSTKVKDSVFTVPSGYTEADL